MIKLTLILTLTIRINSQYQESKIIRETKKAIIRMLMVKPMIMKMDQIFSTTKVFTLEMIRTRSTLIQTMELILNTTICAKD